MAHFAKIENNTVTQVIVADTKEWCETALGGEWVQTSYNTYGGKHTQGGEPLRKNYAGVGYTYDKAKDACALSIRVSSQKAAKKSVNKAQLLFS